MDRRQQKSRTAIYQAFLTLLNQKGYEAMTVQHIIDLADVGRSTFYAHFESKEMLLESLCQDLFLHTFQERIQSGQLIDDIAHLFHHFQENHDKIASLLLTRQTYFSASLEKELEHFLYPLFQADLALALADIPEDFRKHYLISTFVETVRWWLTQSRSTSADEMARYFLRIIQGKKEDSHA